MTEIFIINSIPNGGLCQYTYCLANALYQKKVNFALITAKGTNEIDYFFPKFSVRKILYPPAESRFFRVIRYFLNKRTIKKLINKERPRIIHFQWPLSAQLDSKFIRFIQKKGIKVVYTAHNLLPHETQPKDRKNYKKIYQVVDKIIVHAKQNKVEIIQEFGIRENKVFVIPHGNFIEIAKLNPELDVSEAKQILGLERNTFNLLFFGGIRPYRGLDILLKAMAYLKNIPQIRLIVAGHMKEFTICEDLIDLLKVRDRVNFYLEYIPIKYIGQYFYTADVVVLPYHYIYQSGAIQMAYAFSKPVIATKVGGIPEIVDNGKSGLLIPPNDAKILAKAILKMYNAPQEKIGEMGRYAYYLAKTKFSWDKIAEKTIEVYKK